MKELFITKMRAAEVQARLRFRAVLPNRRCSHIQIMKVGDGANKQASRPRGYLRMHVNDLMVDERKII